ncbi:MAG: hypothetical protein WCL39_09745, partial [Armatimonadota bacterium]
MHAQTPTTLTIGKGWNLISLPTTPLNTDPTSVFADLGIGAIEGKLQRWDPISRGMYMYSELAPLDFAAALAGDSYWLLREEEGSAQFSYAGTDLGTNKWVSMPRMGWNYIGFVSNAAIMPYSDVYVGNNFEVKTMADAIDAFWVDPNASKYDNVTRSLWTVGIDFCDLTYLEKGLGYELLAHSDALMLMYPANPGAPWPGTPTTGSIPAAKTSLDSTQVTLTGKVVSAVFPAEGYCYIQDPAPGFAAIRLDGVTTYPPRSVLDITGTVATASNGERYLQPTSILRQDILEEIQPAAMNNRAVLSGDLAGGSVTAAGATAGRGHHHVGTLIKTNGKVTAVGTGFFYLWDGSYPYGTTSPITDDT